MPTDGQQVSETAKCKCGHDKEIHDWEHGCQHMAGAGPKWMCRCMDFEPAEPVAVPPAPSEMPDEDELWDRHSESVQMLEDAGDWTSVIKRRDFRKLYAELRAALEGKRAC